jgi:hypothetical protein
LHCHNQAVRNLAPNAWSLQLNRAAPHPPPRQQQQPFQ